MKSSCLMSCSRSGRVYVIDTKTDPRAPSIHKVIEPEEIVEKTGLTHTHNSHCLATGEVMISCLGDKEEKGCGYLLLDSDFNIKGRYIHTRTPIY